ncbi:MAG: TraB/VirB10 family protein [Deferrisomatales bacterium]|nr:TraB/VirB10 family protein [Deferrisomatales bacterium]
MNRLAKWFSGLPPKRKRRLVLLGILALVSGLFMLGYRPDEAPRRREAPLVRELTLDGQSLERAKYLDLQRQLEALAQERAKRVKDGRDPRASVPADQSRREAPAREVPAEPEAGSLRLPTAAEIAPLPTPAPAPAPVAQPTPPPPAPPGRAPLPQPSMEPLEEIVGGIEVASNGLAAAKGKTAPQEKKKDRREAVYLPPSFMEATLLTGLDASTSGEGRKSPEPLLLRVQKPAVLPNRVKANLRGCFVIAEATGSLAKERAMVRLVSLSCLDRKGQAVIDQPVKGFVVDVDGKVGLGGRVVSKMGAATARAVIAGIFGGAGEVLQSASTAQTISPLGATQIVDSENLVRASLGGGLSAGANTLRDFYLELAKQATPVIEVGAAKGVTVVISEGVDLLVRDVSPVP